MAAKERYEGRKNRKEAFNAFLFKLFRALPIRKDKIVICTFEGEGGFGCDPRYIVEELYVRNPKYRFVWLVNKKRKKFPKYVKKVRNTAWNRAWHLSTAKIWIDNGGKLYGTQKREEQYFIRTWHAPAASKKDCVAADYVITDSKWSEEMYVKELAHEGEILRTGAPRCDILYGDRSLWQEEVRRECHVPNTGKVVLYLPTSRGKECSLDFERLLENFEKKFGDLWYIGVRLHPRITRKIRKRVNHKTSFRMFEVNRKDDWSELIAAADACITDDFAVAADAGFGSIPVFLYTDVPKESADVKGGMPFSIAGDNDELERNILGFDPKEYEEQIGRFKKEIELVFDGQSSMRAADKIEELMGK